VSGIDRSERAILVVDMINRFAHASGPEYVEGVAEILPFILGELQYFRERMRPVIFCNTQGGGFLGGESAQQNVQQVITIMSPRAQEICIDKSRPNSFFNTDLASILSSMNVVGLTIVGVMSHTSILLTAAAALDYGFVPAVPETCISAPKSTDHQAALKILYRWQTIEQMVGRPQAPLWRDFK
jgi:nicotinamidase-related amidase